MIDLEHVLASSRLPSLPSVAVELLELSKDPNSDIADFASVIRSDPAMSAKLIKAANSPYFGWNSKVPSIEAAILLLGSTAVTSLALSFSLVTENDASHACQHHFESFWSRSLFQAVSADTIAQKCGASHPAQCFLSGLLCDIGVLAQLYAIPNEYGQVLDDLATTNSSLIEIERQALGFDHVEVGTSLMERWNMPDTVIDAIRMHHASAEELGKNEHAKNATFLRTVNFACCLGEFLTRCDDAHVQDDLRAMGQELLDVDGAALNELLQNLRTRTDEAAQLMSIETRNLPQPSELLSLANSQLADIVLREHAAASEVSVKTAVLERENRKLKERNTELHRQVGTDGLTGVGNRGAFEQVFEKKVMQSFKAGTTVGVIFIDLDRFKLLNDTYGHTFGDKVLRRVSQVLQSQVRDADFVARYGGEEFVIIAGDCDRSLVNSIAERIRTRIAAERFRYKGEEVAATVSVGACVAVPPFTGQSPIEVANLILNEADAAMYASKKDGRNQVNVTQYLPSLRVQL